MSILLLTKIGVLLYKEPSWKYNAHPHDLHFILVNFFFLLLSSPSPTSLVILLLSFSQSVLFWLFFFFFFSSLTRPASSSSGQFFIYFFAVGAHFILFSCSSSHSSLSFFFFSPSVEFVHNLSTKCIPAGSLNSAGIDWNCMKRPKRLGSLICVQVSRLYRIKKKKFVGCACSHFQ